MNRQRVFSFVKHVVPLWAVSVGPLNEWFTRNVSSSSQLFGRRFAETIASRRGEEKMRAPRRAIEPTCQVGQIFRARVDRAAKKSRPLHTQSQPSRPHAATGPSEISRNRFSAKNAEDPDTDQKVRCEPVVGGSDWPSRRTLAKAVSSGSPEARQPDRSLQWRAHRTATHGV